MHPIPNSLYSHPYSSVVLPSRPSTTSRELSPSLQLIPQVNWPLSVVLVATEGTRLMWGLIMQYNMGSREVIPSTRWLTEISMPRMSLHQESPVRFNQTLVYFSKYLCAITLDFLSTTQELIHLMFQLLPSFHQRMEGTCIGQTVTETIKRNVLQECILEPFFCFNQ